MSDQERTGKSLWSSGLGRSSGKREVSGSTPTGGTFPFPVIRMFQRIIHNFHLGKHSEKSNISGMSFSKCAPLKYPQTT